MAFPKKRSGENYGSFQKRTAWTAEEDEILKQQVARFGTHCWPEVAAGLAGRTSKACSLRWRCFLSPHIIRPNDEPFSPWEIAIIVLTQKVFGNKWNDIAAYLPMRCNNDIKNYFNLYLKEKGSVFSENCYLRSGYDLSQLLSHEPAEVAERRVKLDTEKVHNNNIEAVKVPRSGSASPVARKPTTPKAKKSNSGSTSPSVRGGVAKGSGKPSRMGLAAASLSAMMSEGYCMDGSYAYGADATAMYAATPDMAAAAATAASQAYMACAHMDSPGMYGSQAVAGYYSSAAGYSYADGADGYGMQLAAHGSGSYAAELHAPQQQQQQQQPALACSDATSDPAAAAAAAVSSMPGSYMACNGLVGQPSAGGSAFEAMLPPADKCAASTPALHASKPKGMLRNSSSGGGSPNASSIYSPLMRFSIGDPDNILGPDADHTLDHNLDHNDPIAAAMGVHWHRITSMDGTDFDSLLSDGCEMQAEYGLNKMLAEYEPSVTSKHHSQGGSGGLPATESSPAQAPQPPAHFTQHSTQQHSQQSMQQLQGGVSEGIDPAAAAAAPQDIPQLLMHAGLGIKIEPTAASVAAHLAALVAPAGFRSDAAAAAAAATSSAGAAAAAHLHPNLHVDVPSPTVSGEPCSHQQQQQSLLQQQSLPMYDTAVDSPPEATNHHMGRSSGGTGSSGGSGSPATTHLSHVNINLGLVNPAIAHLIAGGERGATSAPCTMVAAYTPNGSPNGSYSPNPALPKGAFTQGLLRPHSPPNSWQQVQQLQQQQSSQQLLQQQVHMGSGSRLSPFNNLPHQQQQLQATGDVWGAATPTCTSQQQQHMSSGMYSAASSPHHMALHLPHHHLQQHLQASSMLGTPATPTAASGAGAYASPLRHSSAHAWNSSSPGVHSSQQMLQQQHSAAAAAAAAAAINCNARWSQAQDGSLPLEPTHEEEAELVTLLHVEADTDVAMTDAMTDAHAQGSAGGNAPIHSTAATRGSVGSGPMGLFEGAVGTATAQDQAKLESLIQELQSGAAIDSRLAAAALPEAGDLMELPAWRNSSSGCLGLLPNDCW